MPELPAQARGSHEAGCVTRAGSWPPACDAPGCDEPGVPGRPITVDHGSAGKHVYLVLCVDHRARWDQRNATPSTDRVLAGMGDGRLAALAEEVPAL